LYHCGGWELEKQKDLWVIISVMVLCNDIVTVGYGRKRPGLDS